MSLDPNQNLRELIAKAAEGDVRAFDDLYMATSRWLLSRVRRLVGDSLAEDVLADVYLQVWRSLRTFDAARGQPMAWLSTIARSRALDQLRTERYVHGGLQNAPETEVAELGHTHGPAEVLEMAQMRATVHGCLAALSTKERMVLALAYFGEFTQREISSQTGLPLGSVKTLMSRSQHKLRTTLAPASMFQSEV